MRKIILLLLIILNFQLIAQNTKKNWLDDITVLKDSLLKKPHLFSKTPKSYFMKQLDDLKITGDTELNYWKLSKIITSLKKPNLKIIKSNFQTYPMRIKKFRSGYYLEAIHGDFDYILENKLLAINGMSIDKIVSKIKKITNLNTVDLLNNKSLLEFLNISKKDTLLLTVSVNDFETTVELPYYEIVRDVDIDFIHPEREFFYKRKDERWFWSYGINYGKQLFFKYNVCLSKEYFTKLKDSLGLTPRQIADKYDIHLQDVYDAPTINDFTDKFIAKFKKKHYKKLLIDFRGNTVGSYETSRRLINLIANHKRLKRRKMIYIFIDKTMSASSVKTVLELQKHTKARLIGEEITRTINDSDKVITFTLPNTDLKVACPTEELETVTLKPCIEAEQTLRYYKKGYDAVMQRISDLD